MNRARTLRALGVGAQLLPFAFGGLRLVTTQSDFRYLVTAVLAWAAFAGALRAGKSSRAITPRPAALLVAALGAVVVGMAAAQSTGARNIPAMLIVTVAFAACFSAGAWLTARSRASIQ